MNRVKSILFELERGAAEAFRAGEVDLAHRLMAKRAVLEFNYSKGGRKIR